jgi:hypothetical protein
MQMQLLPEITLKDSELQARQLVEAELLQRKHLGWQELQVCAPGSKKRSLQMQ